MMELGSWSLRIIPKERKIKKFHNYEECFFIYYKGSLCGTLMLCSFDKKWWAHILDDRIRKQFYRDNKKLVRHTIIMHKDGKYSVQQNRNVLVNELVRIYNLDTETKNDERNFYVRVIVDNIFDRVYSEDISFKQIICDLKKEHPNINAYLKDRQIKKSIIKIFQIQDLFLNLYYKCCKTRKSVLTWDLHNF